MKDARAKPGVLAACLLALTEDDGDQVDRQAAALVVAESILMWRRSVTKR